MGNPRAIGVLVAFLCRSVAFKLRRGLRHGYDFRAKPSLNLYRGYGRSSAERGFLRGQCNRNHIVQRHNERERAIAAADCGFRAAQWLASVARPDLRADRNLHFGDDHDCIAGIGFIDTSVNPPVINTMNGTLSQSSVTVNFANPVMVSDADLFGLRMEFDLRKSLATDGNGQLTGAVNPVFEVALLNSTDSQVAIDDFHGGVVGVTGANAFTIQGPHGRQWNVTTNDNTMLDDPSTAVSSFTTNTIVEVSGTLDPVTHDIDASEVEVVSNNDFFMGGLLTSVRPAGGPATQADLYVRELLPAVNGVSDGQIETLGLNGSEKYMIEHINLPLTTLLFNNSELAAGQRVGIGGALSTTNGTTTLTVHRVVLRRQGQAGAWVPGSTMVQNNNAGSFQLNDHWTAGVLLPQPLTVITTNDTNFINVSGLGALTGAQPISIRVVGFILINQATGQPVMVARSVEELAS